MIPLDFVPFKYLITCLTLSICFDVGFDVYLASKLVMVAMSGHVDIESQLRLPISVCILCWSLFCVVESVVHVVGMESTGYPDLYGVLGFDVGPFNLTDSQRDSIKASCDIIIDTSPFSLCLQSNLIPKK
jgi:hypothetical protein